MAENTINAKSKNTVPSFSRGTINQLNKAVQDNKISGPAFHFDTVNKCLAFVDIDNTIYQINLDRIQALEAQLSDMVDPETGEPVKVVEYVTNNIAPVQEQVTVVNETVADIQRNGAAILITSKDLGGGE